MSIRVAFEVGHSATVKGKSTAEGFTHDWELYVKGADSNTNISRFVDKVVFNLHESFPKPKRAFKDPPYALKECGYAGFELDIDIYFRCQRDEQKKITFRYDLTLPSKGSTSASERRYHTFNNPSSEFKRKLMEGGAQIVYPNTSSNDDRSRDAIEDRTQLLSKPKLGSSSSSGGGSDLKKHKSKSMQDDIGMKPSSTFANLFGTPITKLSNSKQSPEQKISNNSSSSSSINTKLPSSSSAGSGGGAGGGAGSSSASAAASASSGNSSKQISQKSSASSSSKDKSDKSSKSKKEKNKVSSSPMKDGKDSTALKKSTTTSSTGDDKHQRRDDVRKEKSHNKDRERAKDKPSKRPASPKALAASRSPKRSASPSSRNSSSNRHLTDGPSSASQSILSARHADEKVSISSSSSSTNKKSKKEKRDKSFEKERERGVDTKKDGKSMSTLSKLPRDEKPLSKSLEKINGTSKKDRDGGGGSGNSTPKDTIRDRNSSSSTNAKYRQVFDSKIDSPVEPMQKSTATSSGLERENKKIDKHDGSDRKHKHKKKDKKEKGRSGSKDRKKDKEKVPKVGAKEMIDENSTSSSTNHKRAYGQTPPLHSTHSASSARAVASTASLLSAATTHSKLSDDSSSDFENDDDYPTTARPSSPPPVKHEKPDVADSMASEQSNMIGLSDAVTKVSPSHRVPLGESPTKQTKKSGKESKSKSLIAAAAAAVASKEEFQGTKSSRPQNHRRRQRQCKATANQLQVDASQCSSSKRKTQSPASIEPPMKMVKKEQIKTESNRDGLNPEPMHQQPQQQNIHSQHQQQIQSDSITSNSSISLPNLSTDSSFRSPCEPTPVDYLSQLRTLQQKIMALQDNSELQQVVEMIAATGCYEITSRTFDFDLCALDRSTVQRLQDFFSQSQSTVIK